MKNTRQKDLRPIRRAEEHAQEPPIIETKYSSIYPADIERLEYNYIATLPDPDNIYNVNSFIGLLFGIQKELIKPALMKPTDKDPGYKGYDIQALDDIFYNIFIPLVAKYHITPTIGLFSFICGVTTDTMKKWKYNSINDNNDIYINNNVNNNIGYSGNEKVNNNINKLSYYTKWTNYIESWILQNITSNNSIGSMFYAKAVLGYSDSQPIKVEVSQAMPEISEKQLESIAENVAALPDHDI